MVICRRWKQSPPVLFCKTQCFTLDVFPLRCRRWWPRQLFIELLGWHGTRQWCDPWEHTVVTLDPKRGRASKPCMPHTLSACIYLLEDHAVHNRKKLLKLPIACAGTKILTTKRGLLERTIFGNFNSSRYENRVRHGRRDWKSFGAALVRPILFAHWNFSTVSKCRSLLSSGRAVCLYQIPW